MVDVLAWHLWAAPLTIYGAVLRTPLPRVHYLTICLLKNVLTSALPPLVEVAARDNSGREMGVMEAGLVGKIEVTFRKLLGC